MSKKDKTNEMEVGKTSFSKSEDMKNNESSTSTNFSSGSSINSIKEVPGSLSASSEDGVKTKVDISVETMLYYAGDFGKYQILLMILFSIVNVLSAFHYFSQTFITTQPRDFGCNYSRIMSGIDNSRNFTNGHRLSIFDNDYNEYYDEQFLINQTRPMSEDKCKGYYSSGEFTELIIDDNIVTNRSGNLEIWKLEDCRNFQYDNHFGYESIVTELDWICKDSWKGALGQSMYFIGAVTGTFMLGIAADKWGRIKALIIAYILALIGNTLTVLSNDLEIFAVSRLIAGLATDTNFVMMYIIVMEYVRPSMRTFGLNICIGIFYCLGCTIVPWVAVALKTWRKFLMSVSAAMVIVPFYYLILPESASWLLTQGKADEALLGYLKIAKINGKIIPDEIVTCFKEAHKNGNKPTQAGLKELFKSPKLRRKICILIFKTMTLTLCYDAISRNVNVEGASPFIVFSLGSLTIFPACLVILSFQDKIGRKALFFIAVLLSAILTSTSGLANALIPKNSAALVNVSIGLSITARLCVVIAFNSGSQYAAELIPTIIRGRGVALIHVVGYAASFLSPLLLYLSRYWPPLPDLILGLLCFVCALATLSLPETLGRVLPVTIEDGEIFGEDDKPCDFICCGRSPSTSADETDIIQERAN